MEYYTPSVPAQSMTQSMTQSIIPWKYIIFTIIMSVVVGLIAYFIIKGKSTVPLAEGFSTAQVDGEVQTIMRKMGAMRADLVAPVSTVKETAALPFVSSHDREPIAETTARCFAKTIPARDLDIIFETWRNRAQKLGANPDFMELWNNVYSTAKEKCLAGIPSIAGKPLGPRDAAPYDPTTGSASPPSFY